jgi:16S rRNA (guanine527-N7)-methyltransferase
VEIARIADLLAPFLAGGPSTPKQLEQISTYLDLLLRWNTRINLTAVRKPEAIVTRHFGESLFAAAYLLRPDQALGAIDVGSGAGFPGLPLKIHAPAIRLTLIESNRKKATFLKEVVRALALERVEVFAGRAQDIPSRGELVTLRAVERYDQILPVAARLVAPGGRLTLLIGSPQADRTPELLPGFVWDHPVLVPHSAARVIMVGKTSEPQ